MDEFTDAELLDRWRGGNDAAGEVLFERYYLAIERFFRNKVPSAELEDLVQQTFFQCTQTRDRLINPDKFRPYLFSIAHNVLRTFIRKRCRKNPPIDLDRIAAWEAAPGPRDIVVSSDEQRLLLEGLVRIHLDYQVILELHYWEEFTTEQIADTLKRNRDTVKGQLQRARKALEDALGKLDALPKVIESTLTSLDAWVRRCRRELGRANVPASSGEQDIRQTSAPTSFQHDSSTTRKTPTTRGLPDSFHVEDERFANDTLIVHPSTE